MREPQCEQQAPEVRKRRVGVGPPDQDLLQGLVVPGQRTVSGDELVRRAYQMTAPPVHASARTNEAGRLHGCMGVSLDDATVLDLARRVWERHA